MDFLQPIYTEKTECQDCYKCVRNCPVKAIKVENGRAMIVHDLCVFCGRCVTACPVGAKRVRDDLPRVKRLLSSGKRVIASIAPSFAAEFHPASPAQMVGALKRLGFSIVSETAIGADIVSRAAASLLAEPGNENRVFISTACPAVVELVAKYHGEHGSSLIGLLSPLLAHSRFLKSVYGEETPVVFIGPCIAKKLESDGHRDLLDSAIGFRDLAAWFAEEGIEPSRIEASPDDRFEPARAGSGNLFPFDGGMVEAVARASESRKARSMSFSGISAVEKALEGLESAEESGPLFLELLACEGGCVNGPLVMSGSGTAVKRLRVLGYAESVTDKAPSGTGMNARPPDPDIASGYGTVKAAVPSFGEDELTAALREVGKHGIEDELNCSGCGYDSCRAFARAMLEGKAEKTMCVSYMRKLAQKKANALIRTMPSGVVVVDRNLKVVECNGNFAALMGEDAMAAYEAKPGLEGASLDRLVDFSSLFSMVLDTGVDLADQDIHAAGRILHASIFSIEKKSFVGGVFQDITTPAVRKERVVAQARKVINKNLAVVQKIAFLLGENAAQSESILNSIIESFSSEDDEDDVAASKKRPAAPSLPTGETR